MEQQKYDATSNASEPQRQFCTDLIARLDRFSLERLASRVKARISKATTKVDMSVIIEGCLLAISEERAKKTYNTILSE